MLGGLCLAASGVGLGGVAMANGLATLVVLGVLSIGLGRATAQFVETNAVSGPRPHLRPLVTPLLMVAAFAASVDASRQYLAKGLALAGASSVTFGLAMTATACAAFVSSLVAARLRLPIRTSLPLGFACTVAGLLSWVAAGPGAALWLVGSALLGVGVAVIPGPLNGALLGLAGTRGESVMAASTVSRNVGSLVGGAIAFVLVAPLGTALFAALALPALAAAGAVRALREPGIPEDSAIAAGSPAEASTDPGRLVVLPTGRRS